MPGDEIPVLSFAVHYSKVKLGNWKGERSSHGKKQQKRMPASLKEVKRSDI